MAEDAKATGPKVASMIGFLIAVAAISVLVYRNSLFATHPAGMAVQGVAILLMIWARFTLKWRSFQPMASPTQGDLITNGPYRFVRHPIYAAIIYFVVAGLVFHATAINLAIGAIAIIGLSVRIGCEEHLLIAAYPQYPEYAARTKRVIPYIL